MAFGQHKTPTFNNNATSITANFTMSSAGTAASVGDLVFVVMCEQNALTTTACTDNLGNTYTAVNAGTLITGSAASGRAFYSRVTNAGNITLITFTSTASGNNCACVGAVFEGPFKVSPLDKAPANQNNTDNTSPFTCPLSGVLSQADELIVCWMACPSSAFFSATAPLVKVVGSVSAAAANSVLGYKVVTATTSTSGDFTATNPGSSCQGTATFMKASAGSTMPADTGAFTLAGIATDIDYDRVMPATVGARAFSYKDATLTFTAAVPAAIQVSWFEISGVEADVFTGYTMPAATGTLTLAGSAAGLVYSERLKLPAALGTFVLAGPATALRAARRLTAAVNAFAFSFKPANLVYTPAVSAAIQVSWFEISGVEGTAAGGTAYTLVADKGTFTLTGFATGLNYSRKIKMLAALGTFVLASPATALRAARRLVATVGAFTLAGINTALNYGTARTLTAAKGTFTLTGFAAGLVYSRKLSMPAALGVFTLANPLTALRIARRLVAVTGVFTLAGIAANLLKGGAYAITAATGALVFAGAARLVTFRILGANKGALTFAGPVTRLAVGRGLVAVKGTLTFAGLVTRLALARALVAVKGTLTFAGQVTRLAAARIIGAAKGSLTFTYWAAGLSKAGAYVLLAGNYALTIAGKATGLKATRKLVVAKGTFTLTGYAAAFPIRFTYRIAADTGALILSGKNVIFFVTRPYKLEAEAGALVFTGRDAGLVRHETRPRLIAAPGVFVVSGKEATLYAERNPWNFGQPGKMHYGRKMYALPGRW